MISAFDLYKVGIGPSSSHTVGPMRAANIFVNRLASEGLLDGTAGLRAEMFGSLGVTGHGHGTVKAVILGLEGEQPDLVDPAYAEPRVAAVRTEKVLRLGGEHLISFSLDDDLVLHRGKRLPFDSNGMRFTASGSTTRLAAVSSWTRTKSSTPISQRTTGKGPCRTPSVVATNCLSAHVRPG